MYGRKKYALKLMYINILGYTVEFGHMEAMELLRSPKYHDKYIVWFIRLLYNFFHYVLNNFSFFHVGISCSWMSYKRKL